MFSLKETLLEGRTRFTVGSPAASGDDVLTSFRVGVDAGEPTETVEFKELVLSPIVPKGEALLAEPLGSCLPLSSVLILLFVEATEAAVFLLAYRYLTKVVVQGLCWICESKIKHCLEYSRNSGDLSDAAKTNRTTITRL